MCALGQLTRNGIGIGDKEVLALCYRALRIPYFKVPRPITPVGFVSVKPNEKNEPREEDCERASDPRACRQLAQARQVRGLPARDGPDGSPPLTREI